MQKGNRLHAGRRCHYSGYKNISDRERTQNSGDFLLPPNEGISLLVNASHLGLPIPTVVKKALNQLHDKSENKENENGK